MLRLRLQAYQKRGLSLASGIGIGYVVIDASKWELDSERDASEFDAGCYCKLLEKAWGIGSGLYRYKYISKRHNHRSGFDQIFSGSESNLHRLDS